MKKEKTSGTKTEKEILKTEFDEKQADTARFVAWLTNGTYYKTKDNTFKIIKRSELGKLVKEKYDSQNYEEAEEILASARKTLDTVVEDEMAQVYSKSIRVTTPTFLKVTKNAEKLKCTRSDIVRSVLANRMQVTIKNLSKQVQSKEKLEKIQRILNSWERKNTQRPRKRKKGILNEILCGIPTEEEYFSLHDYIPYTPLGLNKEIEQWLEYNFVKGCTESGIDKGSAEGLWHNSNWNTDVDLSIHSSNDTWAFSLKSGDYLMSLDLDNVDDPEIYTKLMTKANILAPVGIYLEDEGYSTWNIEEGSIPPFEKVEDAERFFEYCHRNKGKKVGSLLFYYGLIDLPVSGKIQIRKDKQKRVLFNGIAIDEDHKEKLTNNILEQLLQAVDEKRLLKQDAKKLEQKSLDALSKNDIKTSSEITEKLSFLNETKKLSALLASTLVSFINSTQVITFTIPKPLVTLMGATIEQMDLDTQLSEEV